MAASRSASAKIILGLFGCELVEHDSVPIRPFGKLRQNVPCVGLLIYLDVDSAPQSGEILASVIEVVPRGAVLHAPYQGCLVSPDPKQAAVVRMLRGLEDSCPLRFGQICRLCVGPNSFGLMSLLKTPGPIVNRQTGQQ